jgi:hypothetical protein
MYWEPATAAESAAEGRSCRTAAEQWEDAEEKEFGVDGLPLIMRWVSSRCGKLYLRCYCLCLAAYAVLPDVNCSQRAWHVCSKCHRS